MYQLAIFDLDGTLLDTLADLRQGLNYALSTQGFAPRTLPEVRAFVGNGIRKLIERAVPAGTDEAQIEAVFEAFNPYYAVHCADFTTPYPGISELLRQLQADGVVSAVVSNKPDYAVKTLSAQYFPGLLAASAGAKDGVRKKPCPDAVFEVVRQLGAEALRLHRRLRGRRGHGPERGHALHFSQLGLPRPGCARQRGSRNHL